MRYLNSFSRMNKLPDFFAIEDPIVGIRTIIQGVIELRNADPQMISLMQMEIITITPRVGKNQRARCIHYGKR